MATKLHGDLEQAPSTKLCCLSTGVDMIIIIIIIIIINIIISYVVTDMCFVLITNSSFEAGT